MVTELIPEVPTVGWGIGTLISVALGLRYFVSKQNLSVAGDSAHRDLIKNLQDERDEWKINAQQRAKEHDENVALISLLRSQNAMLRLLLLNKGVTEAELTAIGVVP